MSRKYNIPLSNLQHDILEECCKNQTIDYTTLSKKTRRNRVTLIQSLNTLIKNGYIEKQKVNPARKKSKLIFKPTYKGMAYAWHQMGMDIEDVLKTVHNQTLNDYIQLLRELPDFRMYFFPNLAYTFLYAFGWSSNELIDKEADNIVKRSFRRGILESINDNEDLDYDVKNLLTARIKKWLKKTYSSEELKELKEKLMKIRNNIDSTIEAFPV